MHDSSVDALMTVIKAINTFYTFLWNVILLIFTFVKTMNLHQLEHTWILR